MYLLVLLGKVLSIHLSFLFSSRTWNHERIARYHLHLKHKIFQAMIKSKTQFHILLYNIKINTKISYWYLISLNLPLTRCPKWDRHFSSAWIQVKGVLKYLKKTGEAISWRSHGSLEMDCGTCKDSLMLLRNFTVQFKL